MQKYFFLPFVAFASLLFASVSRAQYDTQLVALIDSKPYVLEAPFPFFEVSRLFPDLFTLRRNSIAASNRLIAWYVPTSSVQPLLTDKTARTRSLQVQVIKSLEHVPYDRPALKSMIADLVRDTPNLRAISEDDADTVFSVLNLDSLKSPNTQIILGVASLGVDSFTLLIATSSSTRDTFGGSKVETVLTAVTHVLVNERMLLLTASSPEVSALELRNTMRLTREWLALFRKSN